MKLNYSCEQIYKSGKTIERTENRNAIMRECYNA
jgi:hypothetical protein